jgi:hypothetical protein
MEPILCNDRAYMKALFLDFDGVLHPSTHVVGKDMARLALQGSQAITDTGMFCWTGALEEALHQEPFAEEIGIVVHSSWRNASWATPQLIRELLGPLAHRFMGFVQSNVPREQAIDNFIQRAGIADHIILDDATREFGPGRSELIVTNPLLGVSEECVLAHIRSWARSAEPTERQTCTA